MGTDVNLDHDPGAFHGRRQIGIQAKAAIRVISPIGCPACASHPRHRRAATAGRIQPAGIDEAADSRGFAVFVSLASFSPQPHAIGVGMLTEGLCCIVDEPQPPFDDGNLLDGPGTGCFDVDEELLASSRGHDGEHLTGSSLMLRQLCGTKAGNVTTVPGGASNSSSPHRKRYKPLMTRKTSVSRVWVL